MQAAIGYLRVSTREQGRSGLGLAAGESCPRWHSKTVYEWQRDRHR
jgi:DNA invertase Pin-like site-specific DNA recombinase